MKFRYIVSLILLTLSLCAKAQTSSVVKGVVTSENGGYLAGVNITALNKKSKEAFFATTDSSGKFEFSRLSIDGIYDFEASYVGFKTGYFKNFLVRKGQSNTVLIRLEMADKKLEDVVVVGYGTQKKVNLTGAVSSVNMQKTTDRPISNLSMALAGLSSGLQITQSGGSRPGFDGAKIRVRGQGTLNNSDPLIIIDGAPGNINDINPQDVETVSILKDASSSAIYGSRAANGVILVTTRKGSQSVAKINYQGYLAAQKVSNKMDIVSNYADFMELQNEGYKNSGLAPNFSQQKIEEWRKAGNSDPIKYPNTDWQDAFFRTGWMQSHNLSATGGTDKLRYFISGGYLKNPGIIRYADFEKYNARVNLYADVKPWFTLGTNLYGYVSKHDPNSVAASGEGDALFGGALGTTPGMVLKHPDGRFGGMNNTEDNSGSANNNPFRRMNFYKHDIPVITNMLSPRFFATLKPVKNLSIEASYNYNYTDQQEERHLQDADLWNFYTNTIARSGKVRTYINAFNYKTVFSQMDAIARYTTNLNDQLNLGLMAGASQETYKYKWIRAQKYDLLDESLTVFDATTADPRVLGNMTQWAMHSYFGRMNLSWDDKYLLEGNFRRDASSRFAPGNKRWGFFPSFSAGWVISSEDFLKNTEWINTLKLRASWGSLGNNSTATNYMYQPIYSSANYILNSTIAGGVAQTVLSDPNLTWETTYISNLGIDFSFFKNKLNGSMEFFNKNTEGILIALPAPLVHGTSTVPSQNVAKVRNRGFELNLDWKDQIGEFKYFVGGNFSFVKNKVIKFKGNISSLNGTDMIIEGEPINIQYVLAVDRIIQTDEDLAIVQRMIDKKPQAFASYTRPQKGDFLYKDINGDGLITPDDRIRIGDGTTPLISYGFNIGGSWKGFDFSAFLQGVAKLKVYYQNDTWTYTVRHGLQINKQIAEGRWVEGKTDARYPRLLASSDTRNTQPSDAYVFDKSYLRVKNIQLGYTLPQSLARKILVDKLRIYCSLENPFTFTDFIGLDPEIDSRVNYPTIKQYSFGLNLTF